MKTLTLAERCKLATDCLPQAEYRARLEALHADLLARLRAAELDAERYRWLRDTQCSYTVIEDGTPDGACGIEFVAKVASVTCWGESKAFAVDVDESIDAARSQP